MADRAAYGRELATRILARADEPYRRESPVRARSWRTPECTRTSGRAGVAGAAERRRSERSWPHGGRRDQVISDGHHGSSACRPLFPRERLAQGVLERAHVRWSSPYRAGSSCCHSEVAGGEAADESLARVRRIGEIRKRAGAAAPGEVAGVWVAALSAPHAGERARHQHDAHERQSLRDVTRSWSALRGCQVLECVFHRGLPRHAFLRGCTLLLPTTSVPARKFATLRCVNIGLMQPDVR